MKKLMSILITLSLLFGISACSFSEELDMQFNSKDFFDDIIDTIKEDAKSDINESFGIDISGIFDLFDFESNKDNTQESTDSNEDETTSFDDVTYSEDVHYYSNEEIQELIANIEINEATGFLEYDREDYESPARKFQCPIDGEKESIRNYTIDISPYTLNGLKDEDEIFEYLDPYTGVVITNVSALDYDHIVPLSYAHRAGAQHWSEEEKNNYAFDISVGIPCSASENRGKGAKGPSEYLPDENIEEYCLSWLVICNEYNLMLFEEDYDVIVDVLDGADNITIINNYN